MLGLRACGGCPVTGRDVGVWREQHGTYPAGEVASLPGLMFAVHETLAGLVEGCRGQGLAADWSRVQLSVRRDGTRLQVEAGAWCGDDGTTVEFGFPIDAGPTLADPPPPWRIEFLGPEKAASGPGEPWVEPVWTRRVEPWRTLV